MCQLRLNQLGRVIQVYEDTEYVIILLHITILINATSGTLQDYVDVGPQVYENRTAESFQLARHRALFRSFRFAVNVRAQKITITSLTTRTIVLFVCYRLKSVMQTSFYGSIAIMAK